MPADPAPVPHSTVEPAAEGDRFARAVLDALAAHIAVLDGSGRIITVNRAWRRYAQQNGGDPDKVSEGSNYLSVCEPRDGEGIEYARAMAEGLRAVLAGEQPRYQMEYPCACYAGVRWFIARVTPCHDTRRARAVISHEDITERKQLEEQLRRQAYFDQLTGLPNRTLITHQLKDTAASSASPRQDGHFALLFLDFDGFKDVNDTLGHDVGDALLQAVAERIRDTIGMGADPALEATGPLAARMGGDEFVVLLPGIASRDEAEAMADRLLTEMKAPFTVGDRTLHASASIGVAVSEPARGQPDRVLRDADLAMYRAKQAGKNRYALFEPAMRDEGPIGTAHQPG